MKFKMYLKDPDGVYESILAAVKDSLSSVTGLTEDEKEDLIATRTEIIEEFTGRWIGSGEYVTLEFDTDSRTVHVCET